jgi:hypothetical protein
MIPFLLFARLPWLDLRFPVILVKSKVKIDSTIRLLGGRL